MAFLDSMKSLFGGRKRTLKDIPMDELRKERTRLEQNEHKLIKRVEELEKKKQEFFLKGKDEPSERQRRIYARKIKELDVQAKNIDKNLKLISQQLRVVTGLIQLKENEELWAQMGLSDILMSMDISELQKHIEVATVEGEFNVEKLATVLRHIEEADTLLETTGEDKDIEAILQAMEEARLAEMEGTTTTADLTKPLDKALESEEEEV